MLTPVLLHSSHGLGWGAWHPEPLLVGAIVVALGLYVMRLSHLAGDGLSRADVRRAALFVGGVALVFLALGSPLDVAAGRLFSMHMLQHVILSTWVPPLLLLGVGGAVLSPTLDWWPTRALLKVVTNPFVGAPVLIVNMWFWHIPPVYDFTASNSLPHYVMHLSFLGSGLLFWWTIVPPLSSLSPRSNGWRMFYIFVTGFPMMLLAFVLVASSSPLYDYYAGQPRTWGLSPVEDQQIGGAIMGTLGELTMMIPFSYFFVRLMNDEGGATEDGEARAAIQHGTGINDDA